MTQTLRQLIAENVFAGYAIEPARPFVTPRYIKADVYVREDDRQAHESAADRLLQAHDLDVVVLASFPGEASDLGLRILRMDGQPMYIIWRPSVDTYRTYSIIDEECQRIFHAAWELAKGAPANLATIATDHLLDMPVAAPGETPFSMKTKDREPRLTSDGVISWFEALGGAECVSDRDTLIKVASILVRRDLDDAELIAQRKAEYEGKPMPEDIGASLLEREAAISRNQKLVDTIRSRLMALP